MKDIIILMLKGMIIGIGQIIPGVSGGMLAITLGLYERGISAISNIFNNFVSNLKFLFTVGIGILISVIFFSKIIKYSLNTFYLPTMLLFIGLIIGGLPSLLKKVKSFNATNNSNIFITLFIFIIIVLLSTLNFTNNLNFDNKNLFTYISFFIVGIIYAATMVIPGVSGTAIMMLIGYYESVIEIISNLSSISITLSNFPIVFPFIIGILFGIISVSKLMNYLLKRYEVKTYFVILGLVLSSIIVMILQTLKASYSIPSIFIGSILLIIGYFISKNLEN